MAYDTTKDPRIIAAHLAGVLLKKFIKQKSSVQLKGTRERVGDLVATCESTVMMLMYMYQEPEVLAASEPMKNLAEAVKLLTGAYEKLISGKEDPLLRANICWCLRTLGGLRDRFGNPGTTMASGVDLLVVQVKNVAKTGAFWKTRVTDGTAEYTVITNLPGVESGSRLAAAFLPPREVGGTVSEAMFLGSGKRTEPPGTVLSEKQVDAREAASILYEMVSRPLK